MQRQHNLLIPALLLLTAATAFAAGLGYQHYVANPQPIADAVPSQDAAIRQLRAEVSHLTERLNAAPSPQIQTKNITGNTDQNALIHTLSQQVSALQAQMENLQTQASPTETAGWETTTVDALAYPGQRQEQATQTTHNRVQQLEAVMQATPADSDQQANLQQRVQDALAAQEKTRNLSLQTTQCNGALCKIEVTGKPENGTNLMLTLLEHQVFGDGAEVFSVPDETGNLALYISQNGQPLPQ